MDSTMDDADRIRREAQMQEVFDIVHAARKARRDGLDAAMISKNVNTVRRLIALEIAAEMRLKQITQMFTDITDIWHNNAECSMKDPKYHSEVGRCFANMQCYAEAESECEQLLQQSETKELRRRLKELEASLQENS